MEIRYDNSGWVFDPNEKGLISLNSCCFDFYEPSAGWHKSPFYVESTVIGKNHENYKWYKWMLTHKQYVSKEDFDVVKTDVVSWVGNLFRFIA
jgi:hypothetical protein